MKRGSPPRMEREAPGSAAGGPATPAQSPLRVAVTGSECTGKTTLAQALAARFGTVWTPEAALVHAIGKPGPLGCEDVEPIARRHIATADAAARRARVLLILDTDLLSTLVYSRHYYGSCPEWIAREARARLADLYLLNHPDLPWIPGPGRDRAQLRDGMHARFVEALESHGARVVEVRGDWPQREECAVRAIEALLAEAGRRRAGPRISG